MKPAFATILLKTAVTHTVTYFLLGLAALALLDYSAVEKVKARLKRLAARLDLTKKPLVATPAASLHQLSHAEKIAEFLFRRMLDECWLSGVSKL